MRGVSDLRFQQLSDRKQCACKLCLIQAMQKVALILAGIDAAQQFKTAGNLAHARVVPRCDVSGAELECVI